MAELSTDVQYIKGIGPQRAKALQKVGVTTLEDLVSYFPRSYEDRREVCTIAQLQPGQSACVRAMVAAPPTLSRIRKGLELVKFRAVDETGALDITYFNQAYRKNEFHEGQTYVFFGQAEGNLLRRQMNNPAAEPEGKGEVTGRIVPVYPLTAGVSQTLLRRAVTQGLSACSELLPDLLPDELRLAQGLCRVEYAYQNIHFPADEQALTIARRRLVFEELFLLSLALGRLRSRRTGDRVPPCQDVDLTPFLEALPFSLTAAQRRCVDEALGDMRSGRPMNRLCQGDVGSGKTMVAAACAYFMVKNGRQAALMAPTEILAEQHFQGLAPLLEPLGLRCALLTGSVKGKRRRELLEALSAGDIDLVIGTHALISQDVAYRDLGLVITDEQHRFGVQQRSALSKKGQGTHILVMSATPIPRTLALILYGDLDISVIEQLPPGRQKIDTFAVGSSYHPRLYDFLRRQIQEGRQAYIVCPLVEEGEEGPDERKAVREYAEKLQREVFPDLRVSFLHGRMKPKEKEAVMAAFAARESDILVSTTVIEVGVDVPNATVMVVENAERFGLSQLHQLRGRVGRGRHKSYCILVSDPKTEETRQRLRVMTRTNDGFQIAEEDLRLRGPGDFLGQRQHGLPALHLADLSCDARLLEEARAAAGNLLEQDPDLAAHPAIRQRVQALLEKNAGAMN